MSESATASGVENPLPSSKKSKRSATDPDPRMALYQSAWPSACSRVACGWTIVTTCITACVSGVVPLGLTASSRLEAVFGSTERPSGEMLLQELELSETPRNCVVGLSRCKSVRAPQASDHLHKDETSAASSSQRVQVTVR